MTWKYGGNLSQSTLIKDYNVYTYIGAVQSSLALLGDRYEETRHIKNMYIAMWCNLWVLYSNLIVFFVIYYFLVVNGA